MKERVSSYVSKLKEAKVSNRMQEINEDRNYEV